MSDHRRLLADYAATGSETAFRQLVSCYIDMVYSTARRLVGGDAHLAEDVTQIVFADLARLARTLSEDVLIGGWLHRRTWHVAATLMRSERRRRHRERRAAEMNPEDPSEQAALMQMSPMLDDAINQLSARDRAVIVLRFFEQRDLRTIGEMLGSNEDAAQKRVSRAVEKLRSHFARRGVVVTSTMLATVVAAHAVQAAPVGLASTVAAASLAKAASAGSIGVSTLIKVILMKKATTAVLVVMMLSAAIAVPVVITRSRSQANSAKPAPSQAGDTGTAKTQPVPVETIRAVAGDANVAIAVAAEPVTAASVRKGLVLHFTFDQQEADGKVTDTSGQGNNGQVVGAKWVLEGRHGGAYQFTPPNQYIRVPNSPSLNPANITLAAWVKTSRTDDVWRRILDKSYQNGFAMSIGGIDRTDKKYLGKAAVELGMRTNGNKGIVWSDQVVADGQWHHIVVTYAGEQQVLYIDGAAQRRTANWIGSVPENTYDLTIGLNLSSPDSALGEVGASFDGLIDEPMIFDRAITPEEVAFLFGMQ